MLEEEKVAAVEEPDEDSWVRLIKALLVELDERIEGLVLEDETMVCRAVAKDVEMEEDSERIIHGDVVCGLIQC